MTDLPLLPVGAGGSCFNAEGDVREIEGGIREIGGAVRDGDGVIGTFLLATSEMYSTEYGDSCGQSNSSREDDERAVAGTK